MVENKTYSEKKESTDIWKLIYPYIIRWPWYLISIVLFITIAWTYLRYSTPVYSSKISVLLKNTNISTNPTNSLIEDVAGISNKGSSNIDNEIEILKSIRLLSQVAERLGINHTYKKQGKVIESEVYSASLPIILKSEKIKGEEQPSLINLDIEYSFPNILIKDINKETTKSVKINQPFKYEGYQFVFVKNEDVKDTEEIFKVEIVPIEKMAYTLQRGLNISLVNDFVTVVDMSYNSPNPKKANDILTELIYIYNQDAISDKKLGFDKTQEFINERIAILDTELGGVENKLESFKKSNEIISVESEGEISLHEKNSLESRLLEVETNISLLDSYKEKIMSEDNNSLLPQDITGGDNEVINNYNQFVLRKQELLSQGAKENLPAVEGLTKSIKQAKQQILTTVNQKRNVLQSKRSKIVKELNKSSNIKQKIPSLEKTFRDISRQQQIKESLYLILLQKREEAAISAAITQEKAKVINPAKSGDKPIKPVRAIFYLGAISLGLLVPIGIIYLKELLRNKIESRQDLEELVEFYPIVAELPSFSQKESSILVQNDLSTMSEAFRIMRTNVEYVLSGIKKEARGYAILVTSSIKGEGKTFVSMNYAHILGQLKGKKTIVIGADIRNPQLHRFSQQKNKNTKGLTDFLYEDNTDYQDYIQVSDSDNFTHVMFSGQIPPNPTELLMSDKFRKLIKTLRVEYDYVIVDSAPLLLVSDTLNIGKYMDLTIFVTRSKFTPKEIISIPLKAVKEKRLNHVAFVLNDVSSSHSGYAYGYKYNYGYGYGYGTKNQKKSFWKKLKETLFN